MRHNQALPIFPEFVMCALDGNFLPALGFKTSDDGSTVPLNQHGVYICVNWFFLSTRLDSAAKLSIKEDMKKTDNPADPFKKALSEATRALADEAELNLSLIHI